MPTFLVTVCYDPGTPRAFLVENVADARAARDHVRENIIGYDPGVPVEIVETPITKNTVVRYSNLGRCMD
jgi:hypothetical protein